MATRRKKKTGFLKLLNDFWKWYSKPIKPKYPTRVRKSFSGFGSVAAYTVGLNVSGKRALPPAFSFSRWITTPPKKRK